ncbi:hypothetical protein ES702_01691 [subsurface metagenome]
MKYVYRRKVSGNEKIVAGRQYSFIYKIYAPDLSPENLKVALDLVTGRLTSAYPLTMVTYVLWKEPLYENIELLFTFREAPGQTLYWFSDQIGGLATEYYVSLTLKELATFLPFPWWLVLLALGIGAVVVGAAVKKERKK